MNEIKYNSNSKTTNSESKRLENGAFSVPEGYFDLLENSIFKSTIGSNKRTLTPSKNNIGRTLKITSVAATLLIGFVFAAYLGLKQSREKTNNIVETEKNKKINNTKETYIVQTTIDTSNTIKSELIAKTNSNIGEIPHSNTIKPNTINPIKNFDKIAVIEIKKNSNIIPSINNANTTALSTNNFLNQNLISNNSIIPNNSTIIPSNARIAKSNDFKLFGNDTCSLSEIILSPKNILAGFTYLWSTGESRPSITVKKSGLYWLKATSNESIIIDSIYVTITEEPEFSFANEKRICFGESVSFDSKLTNTDYKYIWSHSSSNTPKIELPNLKIGFYKIKFRVNYCNNYKDDEIFLIVEDCEIKIPNVITPNGDGTNDFFEISELEKYPGSTLRIFDRNGKTIFESNNYTNDWDAKEVASGTYFFFLKVNNSQKTEKGGTISIVR